jgi:acyl carrier protein
LARYASDGSIEYLGRNDDQVKIRGVRIELGEIESALMRHSKIRDCAVAARTGADGKRLVAYVTASQGSQLVVAELRAFLKQKLQPQLIPSFFVVLDALPLSPNGKIDRKALPAPDRKDQESELCFVPPSSPIEVQLVEIWRQVLGVEQIGIRDDFFSLGGHSLSATRVVSRIREVFQIDMPLSDVFTIGFTVEELARAVTLYRLEQLGDDELARTLADLESISDEDAALRLAPTPRAEAT